ncbi:MAG: hypothetical protein SGI99_12670 [Pseudomonadota bacterium]|nr:hypothetical protein [Pseudomonadota bacterium]
MNEASELVFTRGVTCTGDAEQAFAAEVEQIEDALLIEVIGIVALASERAATIAQIVDVLRGDERIVLQIHFAAGVVARFITLKRAQALHQSIRLRSVIVRGNIEIAADH